MILMDTGPLVALFDPKDPQHQGHPYRILSVFDSRCITILLLGGNKTGDDDWYEKWVPLADKL